jgi:hypothetical protein
MNHANLPELGHLKKGAPWSDPEENALDTLAAYVRDYEHELLSVATALQGHVDLLSSETRNTISEKNRLAAVNRTINRIVKDANALLSVSELAMVPPSKQRHSLDSLIQQVVLDTKSAFLADQVALTFNIAKGMTLKGDFGPLKLMITAMFMAVLHRCHKFDTVQIEGVSSKRVVSLSFQSGRKAKDGSFAPWRLGELRLIPLNGDSIGLSTIDAMARLQNGRLSVWTKADHAQVYRLLFKS